MATFLYEQIKNIETSITLLGLYADFNLRNIKQLLRTNDYTHVQKYLIVLKKTVLHGFFEILFCMTQPIPWIKALDIAAQEHLC